MASEAAEYIREVWDSLVHGKRNKKNKNAAIEEIDDFIAQYGQSKLPERPVLPDAPTYERMQYDAPSDEQLRESAEKELEAYKAQGEKGIDEKIAALRAQYEAQAQTEKENSEAAHKKAEESYAAARQTVSDDLLKRGLARSSIAANKQAALGESEAAAKAQIAAEYARAAGELGAKIQALTAQRQAALNDFDLSYATRLGERIAELRAERDEKTAAALRYNNSLAEKEHAARVDKTMKESDLYGEALSQRQKENDLRQTGEGDYAALYAAIAEKLRGINKNDARDVVLNNPSVRASLNNTYYYKLYDEFCR